MKRLIISSSLALLTLLAGCSKLKNLADINVDVPYSTQQTVPPVQGYTQGTALPNGGVALPQVTVGLATNSAQTLQQYGTAAHMVQSVTLKSLAITIQSPAGQNFDFLDNIQVYISAAGMPELLAASASNIPKGTTTLDLTTNTDVNLKAYYLMDVVNLRMTGHINAVPPGGEVLNLASVFHITANPLN